MSDNADPFLSMLGSYRAAVLAKDVDAFAALYDDDVQIFDTWGRWSVSGIAAWRVMASDWFSSLGSERVVISVSEAQTTHIGDLAVGHAILTYTAVSAGGQALRSLSNRITSALRRTGDSWKVFHEHTSVPIDHESTKGILRRAHGG
jgi:ketosteroid isomerase-like protein